MLLYKNPSTIRRRQFSLNFSNKVQRLAMQQPNQGLSVQSTGNCPTTRKNARGCRYCDPLRS